LTGNRPRRVEVSVDAPRDAAWRALSERAELARWFGWDYEGLADEIDFIFFEHATRHGRDRIELEDGGEGQTIELAADGPRRTIVSVARPGELSEGWRVFFHQLGHYLAHHDGEERRTVHLAGNASPAAALGVLEGLLEGEVTRPSRFVALAVAPGEGLVALESSAELDTREPAPVMITISAYGVDDAQLEAIRARWAERWRQIGIAGG
jgi:hypothetical protein